MDINLHINLNCYNRSILLFMQYWKNNIVFVFIGIVNTIKSKVRTFDTIYMMVVDFPHQRIQMQLGCTMVR